MEHEKEIERLRMQLVACGVVAMSNTPESAALSREIHPDYMSASCQGVMDAVDREMALRHQRDELVEELNRLRHNLKDCFMAGWEEGVNDMDFEEAEAASIEVSEQFIAAGNS